jgi:hypothetical protein
MQVLDSSNSDVIGDVFVLCKSIQGLYYSIPTIHRSPPLLFHTGNLLIAQLATIKRSASNENTIYITIELTSNIG